MQIIELRVLIVLLVSMLTSPSFSQALTVESNVTDLRTDISKKVSCIIPETCVY